LPTIEEHRQVDLPPVDVEVVTREAVSVAEAAAVVEVGAVAGVVDEVTTRIEPRKAVASRNSRGIRSPLTKNEVASVYAWFHAFYR
jgi:hypothetical protein